VDETDIRKIRQGQEVRVELDAYPGMPVSGRVIRIDPQSVVQQNVTMIPVTVELAQPDPRFKPGMNATCRFILGEAKNALAVPTEAVKDVPQRGHMVRMLLNGNPQSIPVEIGLVGQELTEIRSGLHEGDRIITREILPVQKPASGGTLPGGLGGAGGRGGTFGGSGGGRGR
jgi:multidrug efflux pump subunit AcrA (membrane-fusion protein)